jgi:hypothetical protein
VGGFREGVEGSQDWDLTLRVIERIPRTAIRHIPHVLYHWRAAPGSAALAPGEKVYAYEAARRAIRAHLQRCGVRAEVQGDSENPTLHRVVYPLPDPAPLVSLILPATRRLELLYRVVGALLAHTDYPCFELLIAGDVSDAGHRLHYLQNDPRVRLVDAATAAPAVAAVEALACARGEIVGLLGLVEPLTDQWLAEMVSHALRPDIGAVGAKLYDEAGAIAHAGIVLGLAGVAGRIYRGVSKSEARGIARLLTIQNSSAVSGACLVTRRSALEQAGGLDAVNLPSVYFDVDLCLRLAESGYRTVWTPYAALRWLDSERLGPPAEEILKGGTLAQEQAYMRSRWGSILANDPNYNPNLSLEREAVLLAMPPRHSVPWASAALGRRSTDAVS